MLYSPTVLSVTVNDNTVSFENFTAGFAQMTVFCVTAVWRVVGLLRQFGGTAAEINSVVVKEKHSGKKPINLQAVIAENFIT